MRKHTNTQPTSLAMSHGSANKRREAEIALQTAAASVARDFAPQLVAAAKTLAAAAYDESTFLRVWVGIGELARNGALDGVSDRIRTPQNVSTPEHQTKES